MEKYIYLKYYYSSMLKESSFSLLGLNEYESKIYRALIEQPMLNAAEISKHSTVPQNRVYDVVEGLISKGLVFAIHDKPKIYSPESPKKFKQIISNKKKELEKLDKEVEQMQKQYSSVKRQLIYVTRNDNNFIRITKSLPIVKKWDYSIRPKLDNKPRHITSAKKMSKRKDIDFLTLYDEKLKDTKRHKQYDKILKHKAPINTRDIILYIRDEHVIFSFLPPKNENAVVHFQNENLALLMKDLIDAYYKVYGENK